MKKYILSMALALILFMYACTPVSQNIEQNVEEETSNTMDTQNTNAEEASNTEVMVTISGFKFMPDTVTVAKGTKLIWTNEDTAPHNVKTTSGYGELNSPTLSKGDTYSYVFNTAGMYEYYCSIHPSMKGKVIVE